jgi:hypothetical protein
MVTLSLKDTAQAVAESHHKMDEGTHTAKYFPSNDNLIKILEVSSSVATSGSIDPFLCDYDEHHAAPCRIEIILLSDEEWKDVLDKKLRLPDDWDLQYAEDLL